MDSEIESVLVPRCWPGRKWGRGATEEAARVLGGNGGKIRTMCYREMRRVSEIFFFSTHPSGNSKGIVRHDLLQGLVSKLSKLILTAGKSMGSGCQRPHQYCQLLPLTSPCYSHCPAASPDQPGTGVCRSSSSSSQSQSPSPELPNLLLVISV